MSKMRIYELAKELGVENKVIIAKAAELGMYGKVSHSSSLDSDEADHLRRAILRQTIAPKDSETVTVRVDRVTGATESIVERRKGNVIRRRKQDAAGEAKADLVEPEVEKPQVVAVAAAPEPAAVEESPEEMPQAGPALATEEPVAEQAPVEEAPVEPVMGAAPAAVEPARQLEPAPQPQVAKPAEKVVEQKKTIGPKILGRIELAKKPAALKPEGRKQGPYTQVAQPAGEEEEEGHGKKKGFKKKGLKREISRIDLVDYEGGETRRAGKAGKKKKAQESEELKAPAVDTKMKQAKRIVKMGEGISVGELARQMSVKSGEVIQKLITLGVMANINQVIDRDIASIVAEEFEYQVEVTSFNETAALEEKAADDPGLLKARPPVVTVMGHVDHGKTTLLDTIRKASVAAREHGGITQHIGAYSVLMEDGRSVTFIDTPGHAAFTSMRARGARVTDIVILVVGADDGVQPQTIEAINHAKAAGVPIIVAVNKIDRPESNPDRVRQQLAEHGVQPEDWGGDSMFFNVSATKSIGIKELLEGVLLVAEVKELKANPDRRARGAVVEVKQDRGRGTVATVLVQSGTLRVGDVFVCGSEFGRVRSMDDSNGKRLEAAGPSTPIEITGLSGVPLAGDDFIVSENEATARQVSADRRQKQLVKEQIAAAGGGWSLESFAMRANDMASPELGVIIKADVQGSVEAVRDAVEKLSNPKVKVRVIHAAVGGVTESDVQLAIASRGVIVGFNVRGELRAMAEAESNGVEIRFYRIIYELLDDVKSAMAGKLPPIRQEVPLGRVEVRNTFVVPKVGTIAGCYVLDGLARRNAHVRLLRDQRVVHEGKMGSLRRFKDDVREVQSGYECGIGIENYNDVKVGDIMEVFEVKEIAATLD